jgi:hypothetical protein
MLGLFSCGVKVIDHVLIVYEKMPASGCQLHPAIHGQALTYLPRTSADEKEWSLGRVKKLTFCLLCQVRSC